MKSHQQLITAALIFLVFSACIAPTTLPSGEYFIDGFDSGVIELNGETVSLSGEELLIVLDIARTDAIAGAHFQDSQWILDSSGEPVDPDVTYSVLVNDFMYAGGDNYALLSEADPEAYNTAIDWRQPVIDWITAQESSETIPLDDALADLLE